MPAQISDSDTDFKDAMRWANQYFSFQQSELVTNHPWAVVFRLAGQGGTAFLKILPIEQAGRKPALDPISKYLSPRVPKLVKSDIDKGYYLYSDHGGTNLDNQVSRDQVQNILETYGGIQRDALNHADLLGALPSLNIGQQFDRLLVFLGAEDIDTKRDDFSVDASHFLKDQTVARYRRIFSSVHEVFTSFLTLRNNQFSTINHCDLRAKNVAQLKDGSLAIFDWDDAVFGPPGLSLHAVFSGSARPFLALKAKPENLQGLQVQDRQLLDAYLDALSTDSPFQREAVASDLPAVICAGVIQFIVNFGSYPVRSRRQRDVIGKNIRRRLSDLMTLAHLLVLSSPAHMNTYVDALNENGRPKRAQMLVDVLHARARKTTGTALDGSLASSLAESDKPGVFPTVELSAEERQMGVLSGHSQKLGVALFKRHGTLLIKNAISKELVRACHNEFLTQHDAFLKDNQKSGALRVGDKRYMITLKFSGTFSNPGFYASPMVLPILKGVLGSEAILGSLTSVASLPGAEDQRLHKDNSALFKENSELPIPSFSVALIVPLIALGKENGATRVVKGSHKKTSTEAKSMPYQDPVIEVGSCFLMDCRLSHQGMANNSDSVRPITSLVFQRPWYRDYQNFKNQKTLDVDAKTLKSTPKNLRHLVDWAI